ncbi:hypothetical protein [Aporhodopirellula aestuarii]|uniref:Uncharacterized protein n=1 Tax=Aporhodopirellula aestuarii TaxID=2950107 RepID=A0ABT0U488_9BACT|nr:hypothetical protein [Aporhodopirellula aestuarii]MCM2371670.1 hypothetical protein [Aporhodopirellula aestuarii]
MSNDFATSDERQRLNAEFGSKPRWFMRGLAVGMLFMASLNALSYFVRSEHWGSLVGKIRPHGESIGFPFEIWESGNMYGGMFADYPMIGLNILVAIVVSLPIAILTTIKSDWLNKLMFDSFQSEMSEGADDSESQPIQFSIQSLMIATTVAAVFAMIASRFAARKETLIFIYALGPLSLVLIAMLPRRLSWQQRVAILTPCAFALIAVAMAVGQALNIDFDKVLMGIFLCWTPQSAIAAIVLTIVVFAQLSRSRKRSAASPPAAT